jgi:hypothetical protein
MKPEVFISATGDLASARRLVAEALTALGYSPVWQDVEATQGGELLAVLEQRLMPCDLVVQLVGHRYGAEPPQPPPGLPRCSYTQFEALHAEAKGKKVVYLWLPDSFPTDPIADEAEELLGLQRAYRERLKQRNVVRHHADTPDRLEKLVLRLRDDLSEARTTAAKKQKRLMVVAGLTLIVAVATLFKVLTGGDVASALAADSWVLKTLADAGLSADDIDAGDFAATAVPYRYGEPGQAKLVLRVTDDVKPVTAALDARVDGGLWSKVLSDGSGELYALISADDLQRGGRAQVRLSDLSGATGGALGPYDLDLEPGPAVEAWQRRRIAEFVGWLAPRGRRLQVDQQFFHDCDELLAAVRWGGAEGAQDHRAPLPAVAPPVSGDPSSAYGRRLDDFVDGLPQAIQDSGVAADTLFARVELRDGSLGPLLQLPWNTLAGGVGPEWREARRFQEAIGGDWVVDEIAERGVFVLAPLRNAMEHITAVHFGGDRDALDVYPMVTTADSNRRKDRWLVYPNNRSSLAVTLERGEAYMQLEFADGTTSEVRALPVPDDRSDVRVVPAADGADAPRLVAIFRPSQRHVGFLPDAPPETERILVAFGDGELEQPAMYSGYWDNRGFQVFRWGDGRTLRILFQLADGSEAGPFTYDLAGIPDLIAAASADDMVRNRRQLLRATRLDFTLDPEQQPASSSPDYDAWRRNQRAIQSAIGDQNGQLFATPAVVVRRGQFDQRGAWVAVRELRLGPSPDRLEQVVAIEEDAFAVLRDERQPIPWSVVVPGELPAVFAQVVLRDGRELEPFQVPGSAE